MHPTVANKNCPACLRLLQNRRFQRCAWCGHAIPAALLLTPEEITEDDESARIAKKKEDALSSTGKGSLASGSVDAGDVMDLVEVIGQALDLGDFF